MPLEIRLVAAPWFSGSGAQNSEHKKKNSRGPRHTTVEDNDNFFLSSEIKVVELHEWKSLYRQCET